MACYRRKSTVWPGKLISSKKTPKNSIFWRQNMDITSLWEDLEAKIVFFLYLFQPLRGTKGGTFGES